MEQTAGKHSHAMSYQTATLHAHCSRWLLPARCVLPNPLLCSAPITSCMAVLQPTELAEMALTGLLESRAAIVILPLQCETNLHLDFMANAGSTYSLNSNVSFFHP